MICCTFCGNEIKDTGVDNGTAVCHRCFSVKQIGNLFVNEYHDYTNFSPLSPTQMHLHKSRCMRVIIENTERQTEQRIVEYITELIDKLCKQT